MLPTKRSLRSRHEPHPIRRVNRKRLTERDATRGPMPALNITEPGQHPAEHNERHVGLGKNAHGRGAFSIRSRERRERIPRPDARPSMLGTMPPVPTGRR